MAPAPTLNQDQRTSLEKMYSLYHDLKNASKDLALEFRGKVPEVNIPVALSQLSGNESKEIEKSLQEIDWTEASIKTQKGPRGTKFFNPKSWKDWNENPFKHFYTRAEEFETDIGVLQKNARAAFMQQQDLERVQSRYVERHRRSPIYSKLKEQYEANAKRIASLTASQDAHIVQRVASHLLKSMGRLNNPT